MRQYKIRSLARTITAIATISISALSIPHARAQNTITDNIHGIIHSFSRSLFTIAQTSGGDPLKWQQLQQETIGYVTTIANRRPEKLTETDARGRTPLIVASELGFLFLVEYLLQYQEVQMTSGNSDVNGLSAYDYAAIAASSKNHRCLPKLVKGKFVSSQYSVVLPYYRHIDPFPKIAKHLNRFNGRYSQKTAGSYWNNTNNHIQQLPNVSHNPQMVCKEV